MSFFRYIRSTLGIKDRVDLENAKADITALNSAAEKTAANIDYIAMMSDVDIPTMSDAETSTEKEGDWNVV